MSMASSPENMTDLKLKLKVLSDVMKDLATSSPSALKIFLKDYQHFFSEETDTTNSVFTQTDASSQTDSLIDQNAWNLSNITEDVTYIAEKVTQQTGFSYDHNSGWYYDHKIKCYYNANCRLYYYSEHKAYYYYDEESKGLKYYCSLESQTPEFKDHNFHSDTQAQSSSSSRTEKDIVEENYPFGNQLPSVLMEEVNSSKSNGKNIEKEDGECSDTDQEETLINSPKPVVIEAGPTVFQPNNTKHFAPCIRAIVKTCELPNLCIGTLFIVTCTGGTIGREGEHDILIPDHLVSKLHSKFQYVYKDGYHFYELIDLGSKNGTFVNGKRLSDTLVQSEPATITHGCIITVGHTDLLCHIHPYDETCSECVPFNSIKESQKNLDNRISLKEKYDLEASFIRKKFGINNRAINKLPEGYEDRAQVRRKQVGSSHPSEKTETASINEPICKKNKGYTLLSKMGWKEGETLGMRNEGATLEPIMPIERQQKNSGLGCDLVYSSAEKSKKKTFASKTLQRYKQEKDSERCLAVAAKIGQLHFPGGRKFSKEN